MHMSRMRLIVVVTDAGISAGSGVATIRGLGGLWPGAPRHENVDVFREAAR